MTAALRDETAAVLVAFHPDTALAEHARAALHHACRLVVVDNTPGPAAPVLDAVAALDGAELIRLGDNAGLASALNVGVERLSPAPPAWVLLLDQDTALREGFSAAVAGACADPGAGIVGVNFVNSRTGRAMYPETGGPVAVPFVITSGSLVRWPCLLATGPFAADYFVDAIDVEYGLRARACGWAVVRVPGVGMDHGMGNVTVNRVLGYARATSEYSPLRHYYMARNVVATALRHGWRERAWLVETLVSRAKFVALTLVMERGRVAKLRAIVRGTLHGLAGRMGPAR